MKISELIKQLEIIQKAHSDIEVRTLTLSHSWPPDLIIKKSANDEKVLILNG